jgi:hypothetical protein
MYIGPLIKFNERSLRELKARKLGKKATLIIKQTKKWAKIIGIDPETRIQYHYVEDPRILLKLDIETAEYRSFHLAISKKCFREERDEWREMDILHEMLHIMLWQNYVRNVVGVVEDNHHNFLREHEETLVSKLELQFYRMEYGQDCMPAPSDYDWGEYKIYKKDEDDEEEDKEKLKKKSKRATRSSNNRS